jgi:hypothetical protein
MDANTLSTLIVFAVIAVGVIGYFIGLSIGREEGRNQGYVVGNNAAVDKITPTASNRSDYPKSNVNEVNESSPYHRQGGGGWR